MAQDFFAAFGHDAVGTIGTPTTITWGDLDGILMLAAQALEKRTAEQSKEIDSLRGENATLKGRLEALERRLILGGQRESRTLGELFPGSLKLLYFSRGPQRELPCRIRTFRTTARATRLMV